MPTDYPKRSLAALRIPFRSSSSCRGWSRAFTPRHSVTSLRCSRISIRLPMSRRRRRLRCRWHRLLGNSSGWPRPHAARMRMRWRSTSFQRQSIELPSTLRSALRQFFAFVVSQELAIRAPRKQQRLPGVIGIGLDRAEKDHVIATIVAIDGSALKVGDALGDYRSVTEAPRPVDSGELVVGRFCKLVRKRLLRCAKHVDGEVARILKHGEARRIDSKAPEDQRGIQGNRCKRIAGDA